MFITLIALTVSGMAAADSTKIFEMRNYRYLDKDVSTTFQVNTELGRAWVNVELTDRGIDDVTYDDHRVKVEGLSLNAEKTAIVLEKDGALVECATVTPKRGILNRRLVVIRPTGLCTFTAKTVKVDVDNGFEIRKVPMLQVFLNVE